MDVPHQRHSPKSRRPQSRRSGSRPCRRGAACQRCRRSTAAAGRTSRPTGAATGRSGSFWCCSWSRCSPSSSPTTSRSWSRTTARSYFPVLVDLSGDDVRRRFRDGGRLSRPLSAEADRRQGRLHDLAADPLFLRHAQSRPADAGAVAADLDADRAAMPAGRRTQGSDQAAATSNTTGSAPTTRAATWWRG